MNSIVVYTSRHGNTERIAYAIGAGLENAGPTRVFEASEAPAVLPEELELIVIGGPTEAHSVTKPMADFMARLGGLRGRRVAAFDTRLRMARWISGSAAVGLAKMLRGAGAILVCEPASFFVSGKDPRLEPGELERAEAWAVSLGERLAAVPAKA